MDGNAFSGIGTFINSLLVIAGVLLIGCCVFAYKGCGTQTFKVKKMVTPEMRVVTENNKSDTTYIYKFK